jgi:reactive chlorine resistance protein C
MRCGLATCLLWIGALKFRDYEVQNAEPLVTASPLTSRLREKLGAQKLARIVGVTQITLGSLIAAKPFAPQASAVGSFGAAGMMLVRSASWPRHRKLGRRGEGCRSCPCWARPY